MLVDLEEGLCPREFGEYLDRKNRRVVDSTICCVDEDEELVTKNDPSRSFIPIEEFPDNIDFEYPEISGLSKDEEYEILSQGPVIMNFTEPTLVDDEKHLGRIVCAFADAKTGCIILIREKKCNITTADNCYESEIIADDDYERFYPRIRGTKALRDDVPLSMYDEKFRVGAHDNLKTMPDRKVQRMNRATLRAFRRKF